jgi:quercetin dioxygenase-like cupin family protein
MAKEEGDMQKVIGFLSFVLLSTVVACPVFAQETKDTTKVQIVKIDDIKEFNPDKFIKKNPLDTGKMVFNAFYLKPRQILPFHKHTATDELFYIVEGTGEFTVGNTSAMVAPGSAVYGPTNVFHGLINSGDSNMVVVSVQAPKPVEYIAAENSTLSCSVCKQELILKADVKEGDIYICPRCGAKLKVSKTKDGKWIGTKI